MAVGNEKWRYVCQVIEQGLLKATGKKTIEEALEEVKKGKERIGLAKEAAEAYTDLLLALTIDDEQEKDRLLRKYTMQAVEKALKAMGVKSVYIKAAKMGWQIGSPIGEFFAENIKVMGNKASFNDAVASFQAAGIGMNRQDVFYVNEVSGRSFLYKYGTYYELRNKGIDHFIDDVLHLVGRFEPEKEWVRLGGD
jgi:hypothetical protein